MALLSLGRFGHIDLLAVRFLRRASSGAWAPGATGGVVFCGDLAKIEITPNVETGSTLTADAGVGGRAANSWDVPDKTTGWGATFRFSNISDELLEILSLGEQIQKDVAADTKIVGTGFSASETCAAAGDDFGTIVEMWSRPVLCGSQLADGGSLAYRLIVFPYAKGFVISEAYGPGPEFFPYVFGCKLAGGTGNNLGSGPYDELADIDPAVNTSAPDQTKAWYDIWTITAPPSCTDPNTYITVPS